MIVHIGNSNEIYPSPYMTQVREEGWGFCLTVAIRFIFPLGFCPVHCPVSGMDIAELNLYCKKFKNQKNLYYIRGHII